MRTKKLTDAKIRTSRGTDHILFYSVCDKDIEITKRKGTIVDAPSKMMIYKNYQILFIDDSYVENIILLSRRFVKERFSCLGRIGISLMSEKHLFNPINFKSSMDVDIAYLSFDTKADAAKFKLSR